MPKPRPTEAFLASQRSEMEYWARGLLSLEEGWCILDTETTGLGTSDQAVEIGILAPNGDVLFDAKIRPTIWIPDDAIKVHGITNELVSDAYGYAAYHSYLRSLLHLRVAVIYNAEYDVRIMRQTARAWGFDSPITGYECAMLRAARWWGDWNDYRGDFRWPKLSQMLPDWQQAHNAINDCRQTLKVMQMMAGIEATTTGIRNFTPNIP